MDKTVKLISYKREIVSVKIPSALPADSVNVNKVLHEASTGDVILFDGNSFISEMIKIFTWSDYSHIGMVVRIPTEDKTLKSERLKWMEVGDIEDRELRERAAELFLLHATDFTELPSYFHPYERRVDGVQLSPLYAYLKIYKGTCVWRKQVVCETDGAEFLRSSLPNSDFYPVNQTFLQAANELQLRNHDNEQLLNWSVNCLKKRTLFSLLVAVCVAQYEIETWRLLCVTFPNLQLEFLGEYQDGDYRSFFCSDLVALVYQALGWIKVPAAKKACALPEMFPPHAFSVVSCEDQTKLFGREILGEMKKITFS